MFAFLNLGPLERVVLGLCLCSPLIFSTALAAPEQSQFDTLVEQGQQHLRTGDLRSAAAQFSAAASLKTAPSLLLRVVSLYSDISHTTEQNQCAQIEVTLKHFFLQCARCSKAAHKKAKCGVCDFVSHSKDKALATRTEALAVALEKRSRKLGEAAGMLDKESQRRTRRRSSGLAATAADLRRCMGDVEITTRPAGAEIRIDGRPAGTSPTRIKAFLGQHELSANLVGFPPVNRNVLVSQGAPSKVDLSLSASPSDGPPPRVWPWVTVGTGIVAAGVGTFFMVDAAATSEEASQIQSNGRVTLSRSEYDDARTMHTMGTVIMSIGSTIVISGLTWVLLGDSTSAPTGKVQSEERLKLGVAPTQVFLGGSF